MTFFSFDVGVVVAVIVTVTVVDVVVVVVSEYIHYLPILLYVLFLHVSHRTYVARCTRFCQLLLMVFGGLSFCLSLRCNV